MFESNQKVAARKTRPLHQQSAKIYTGRTRARRTHKNTWKTYQTQCPVKKRKPANGKIKYTTFRYDTVLQITKEQTHKCGATAICPLRTIAQRQALETTGQKFQSKKPCGENKHLIAPCTDSTLLRLKGNFTTEHTDEQVKLQSSLTERGTLAAF